VRLDRATFSPLSPQLARWALPPVPVPAPGLAVEPVELRAEHALQEVERRHAELGSPAVEPDADGVPGTRRGR
jgi:hypothetical protein